MSQAAKWYVVHTYSGYENKVVQNIEKVVENRKLHDLIQEVYVPTEHVTEIVDGKQKEVERKTFPGYVLVKMVYTDDSWAVVRNTRGVTGFVGPGSVPTPLTDKEVASMGIKSVNTVVVDYQVGDRIRVTGTNLDGFTGVVRNIDIEKDEVEVLVNMFGRDTPTTIALHQAVKLDD
ncbi:MAG: transcription termination/antitermination protein NusG [Oscillospiraceae bacterium]